VARTKAFRRFASN
ncbi:glutamate decarboxylase, partial [Escherichia coli EC1849]